MHNKIKKILVLFFVIFAFLEAYCCMYFMKKDNMDIPYSLRIRKFEKLDSLLKEWGYAQLFGAKYPPPPWLSSEIHLLPILVS